MEIREKIKIINEWDEVLKKKGIISEVRKVEAEGLVDTGAVMMLIGHLILEALDLILDPVRGKVFPRPESPFLPTLKMK